MENLEEIISYYKGQGAPADQTALVSMFREIQQECGGAIPAAAVTAAADKMQVKESYLLAIIRRIPRLRLDDKHCLEICAGPNCGKHREIADFAEKAFADGKVTVRYAPCMRMCGKGPNIKWDGKLYHHADKALLQKLAQM